MKITESRANDILHWLDDETGNHALLFEKMTLHRDAAALIRQLQAELQDAWHARLDAGREQGRGKDHAYPSPSVEVDANELAGVRARLKSGDYDGADVMRAWLAIDKLLAQQSAVHPRSTHRVWRGDDWQPCYCEATDDHRIGSEQPAAVDEAMVERACKAAVAQCAPDEVWPDDYKDADDLRAMMQAALTAALAAQPGGSDNGR
jgi:hypothetical protein